jgi:hypothetical protein
MKPGKEAFPWDYIVVKLAEDRENKSRKGRLGRTEKYHYTIDSYGEEHLNDLARDPGEMHNLSANQGYDSVRLAYQEMLLQWMAETGDDFIPNQSSY